MDITTEAIEQWLAGNAEPDFPPVPGAAPMGQPDPKKEGGVYFGEGV